MGSYHAVLKASPGTAIFGCNMLFDIPLIADWNKIGDYRQHQTNLNTARINSMQVDYDYKVGNKVLVKQDGILCKAESPYRKSHGLSQKFLQMEQSGFNAKQNWNESISGE
jgi:hypothetical protein